MVGGDRGTLGDGAETGTLEDGAVCTGTLGGAGGTGVGRATRVDGGTEVACWLAWPKMQANCWMAWSWASPIWEKGATMGLARTSARARAALTAVLAEELFGKGQSWGENSTVLTMSSAQVLGMYTR